MIKLGDEFRSDYADSRALWKVIKKKGKDVYLCEIVNEKVEYNGKIFDGDYAGVQKAFLVSEIERAVSFKNLLSKIHDSCEYFYNNLKVGEIVHYHDGFNKFVRCEVNESKELVPLALVGEWRDHELPKRMFDGTVNVPYNCKKIINKEPFKPNALNIYEHPDFSNKNNKKDPRDLPEVNINVPDQTDDEKQTSKLWFSVKEIQEEISKGYNQASDPRTILEKIKVIASKN